MHISDGVAPLPVVLAGAVLAAGGVAMGLRAMKDEQVPRAALMAAAIFAASIVIRLPLGYSSAHPVLNGLAGLMLGWVSVPVFLIALFLETLLFQFGGITALGINTVTMSLPAVTCYYLFGRFMRRTRKPLVAFHLGALAATTALALSFGLWAGALMLSGEGLEVIVKLAALPHLVMMLAESLFTGFITAFLVRVYPVAFENPVADKRSIFA